jgi:hypothetical protein
VILIFFKIILKDCIYSFAFRQNKHVNEETKSNSDHEHEFNRDKLFSAEQGENLISENKE